MKLRPLSLFDEALEIRIAYAQAKIGKLLMSDVASSDEMMEVMWAAEEFGHGSYPNYEEAPAMFQGEPALLRAWAYGWNLAAESAEMAGCHSCNDGTGNPCPVHG